MAGAARAESGRQGRGGPRQREPAALPRQCLHAPGDDSIQGRCVGRGDHRTGTSLRGSRRRPGSSWRGRARRRDFHGRFSIGGRRSGHVNSSRSILGCRRCGAARCCNGRCAALTAGGAADGPRRRVDPQPHALRAAGARLETHVVRPAVRPGPAGDLPAQPLVLCRSLRRLFPAGNGERGGEHRSGGFEPRLGRAIHVVAFQHRDGGDRVCLRTLLPRRLGTADSGLYRCQGRGDADPGGAARGVPQGRAQHRAGYALQRTLPRSRVRLHAHAANRRDLCRLRRHRHRHGAPLSARGRVSRSCEIPAEAGRLDGDAEGGARFRDARHGRLPVHVPRPRLVRTDLRTSHRHLGRLLVDRPGAGGPRGRHRVWPLAPGRWDRGPGGQPGLHVSGPGHFGDPVGALLAGAAHGPAAEGSHGARRLLGRLVHDLQIQPGYGDRDVEGQDGDRTQPRGAAAGRLDRWLSRDQADAREPAEQIDPGSGRLSGGPFRRPAAGADRAP